MVSIVTEILYKIQVVKILFAKAVTEESERDAEGSTFFVVQNNKLYTKDGRSHCDIICGFLPFWSQMVQVSTIMLSSSMDLLRLPN